MAHRPHVVAFHVNDEGPVAMGVVVGAQAGCAVVLACGAEGGGMEGVHGGVGLCLLCQMTARGGRWAAIGRGAIDEPHVRRCAIGFGGVGIGNPKDVHAVVALEGNALAQGR